MSLDGGYGDVIPSSTVILPDSIFSEKMIAIGGNNCDLWLITHKRDTALFYSYRVTNSGINPPIISAIGTYSGLLSYDVGVLKATPSRQKIVCASLSEGTELYDFDPNTGLVSNCLAFNVTYGYGGTYGAEFSPDNTKLYLTETNYTSTPYRNLYQYDISSSSLGAILDSKTLIAPLSDYAIYDLKLGPDNKIYYPNRFSLNSILYPDSPGTTCGYITDAVNLAPNQASYGLSNVFVNIPSAIIGIPALCSGNTTTFFNAIPGGIWSSSNPSIATIGTASGVLAAISPGVTSISYTQAGCTSVTTFSVIATPPPIAGNLNLCVGHTTSLINAASGGTWSSASLGIATVGSTSGLVTGVSVGTDIITYSLGIGCTVSTTVNVIPSLPPIVGDSIICSGGVLSYSDSIHGGYWLGTTGLAPIDFTLGIIHANYACADTIIYNMGGCTVTKILTVNPRPAISAPYVACVDYTFSVSATPAGGIWNIDTGMITIDSSGFRTALDTGNTAISYTNPVTGCMSVFTINVIAAMPPIMGPNQVCFGTTITLSDSLSGGTWSEVTGVSTVGPIGGTVFTNLTGVDTIIYSLHNACSSATYPITINPSPAMISGVHNICVGDSIMLTDSVTGGTWSDDNITIALIGSASGKVIGLSVGSIQVSYTLGDGCFSTATQSVIICPSEVTTITRPSEIYVYPNPAQSELNISWQGGITNIEITDLLGETLHNKQYYSRQVVVDVSAFPTGIYLVKVNGSMVRKFAKQ